MSRAGRLPALLALALLGPLGACYQLPAPVVYESRVPDLPVPEAKPAPAGEATIVVVARGDTLFEIARAHDVALRELIEINRLAPPYTLLVGQLLRLPAPRYHVVAKGDTVYGIARRYDIDMSSLVRLNRIEPPYTLYVGDRLRLPASAPAPAAAPSPAPGEGRVVTAALTPPAPAEPPAEPPPVPPAGPAGFSWPARGEIVSSFGSKPGNLHNDGVNIALPKGTPIQAVRDGTVAYVGNELKGYGNLVLIRHDDGWISAYAHNDALLVERGQKVRRGQVVAYAGATGNVASPQLHFELRKQGEPVDPLKYLGG